ncbi:MAG: ribosomal RNA small subunit methyltransferase A [Candidatus Omnitrophica bacterium]|nr:ribosomal RNA small subunit methyltransferase A [Candidatus Omnitrophota bacterium]
MKKLSKEPNKNYPAFVAEKRLGQNFLHDRKVQTRIIEACQFSPEETVLEIGPGQGALTRQILPCVKGVIAVEADRQLAEGLEREFLDSNLTLHHGDFLKFDFSKIPGPIKVVGNLPYYISTPIISKVLENREKFTSLFMTVQLEFGERLVAKPGNKIYSSFTCFVNYFSEPKLLFTISKNAFSPAPKVMSCFMRLDMRKTPPVSVKDEPLFLQVIRLAFQQRRKTLLNSLSQLCPKAKLGAVLAQAGVPERTRAEELGLEKFAMISNCMKVALDG